LNKYYKRALSLSKKYAIELSFFEIQVLVMVMYFCDQKVDYAVIEV
jgi:folylpolyglutamate synthase/dihydropteroate synthase